MFALFDFDKTIVQIDSFRLFARMAAGSCPRRLGCFAQAVLCKLGFVSNTHYKERILAAHWFSKSTTEQTRLLNAFFDRLRAELHPVVTKRLREHVEAGDAIGIVSASPEFYLKPFVDSLCPVVRTIGSEASYDGRHVHLTNLQGEQKAQRARDLIHERSAQPVVVYTDHVVDLPLLRLANRAVLVRPSRRLVRETRRLGIPFEVIP